MLSIVQDLYDFLDATILAQTSPEVATFFCLPKKPFVLEDWNLKKMVKFSS